MTIKHTEESRAPPSCENMDPSVQKMPPEGLGLRAEYGIQESSNVCLMWDGRKYITVGAEQTHVSGSEKWDLFHVSGEAFDQAQRRGTPIIIEYFDRSEDTLALPSFKTPNPKFQKYVAVNREDYDSDEAYEAAEGQAIVDLFEQPRFLGFGTGNPFQESRISGAARETVMALDGESGGQYFLDYDEDLAFVVDLDSPVWDPDNLKYLMKIYFGPAPVEERPGEGISTEDGQRQSSDDDVSSVPPQDRETQPDDVESDVTGGVPTELDFLSLPTPEEGRADQARADLSSLAQEMADFSFDMVTNPAKGVVSGMSLFDKVFDVAQAGEESGDTPLVGQHKPFGESSMTDWDMF